MKQQSLAGIYTSIISNSFFIQYRDGELGATTTDLLPKLCTKIMEMNENGMSIKLAIHIRPIQLDDCTSGNGCMDKFTLIELANHN
jgi:hypothetical protein